MIQKNLKGWVFEDSSNYISANFSALSVTRCDNCARPSDFNKNQAGAHIKVCKTSIVTGVLIVRGREWGVVAVQELWVTLASVSDASYSKEPHQPELIMKN